MTVLTATATASQMAPPDTAESITTTLAHRPATPGGRPASANSPKARAAALAGSE